MKKVAMNFLRIVGVSILILFALIYIQNRKPQIQFGLKDDGQFFELSNRPNCVSTQTLYEDKRIMPLKFKESLQESKRALVGALENYGGIEIKEDEDTYIYAVATTDIMRFNDDIEVFFDVEEGIIHYRSSSRAGYSDLGLNRVRYELIAEAYGLE